MQDVWVQATDKNGIFKGFVHCQPVYTEEGIDMKETRKELRKLARKLGYRIGGHIWRS